MQLHLIHNETELLVLRRQGQAKHDWLVTQWLQGVDLPSHQGARGWDDELVRSSSLMALEQYEDTGH
ncbi:hypothetical protein JOQ06_009862 [Pogonophryne albipinna]|uniref:Uncharacterized protein n=1 Tax=Pogonophryne albipinna TaxID=1090488 RepID=A0AAD6BRQ8_9TELE|nr:hypothetical protein JOQ06_009862 [Pogonophryne albipinna]